MQLNTLSRRFHTARLTTRPRDEVDEVLTIIAIAAVLLVLLFIGAVLVVLTGPFI